MGWRGWGSQPATESPARLIDLARAIHEAFEIAVSGRPGPVLVDIPKDIQFAEGTYVSPADADAMAALTLSSWRTQPAELLPAEALEAVTLEEIATEMKGKVKVAKLNIDENPAVAGKLGIRSIPTLMLFKDGKLASQMVGAKPKGDLSRWISSGV